MHGSACFAHGPRPLMWAWSDGCGRWAKACTNTPALASATAADPSGSSWQCMHGSACARSWPLSSLMRALVASCHGACSHCASVVLRCGNLNFKLSTRLFARLDEPDIFVGAESVTSGPRRGDGATSRGAPRLVVAARMRLREGYAATDTLTGAIWFRQRTALQRRRGTQRR